MCVYTHVRTYVRALYTYEYILTLKVNKSFVNGRYTGYVTYNKSEMEVPLRKEKRKRGNGSVSSTWKEKRKLYWRSLRQRSYVERMGSSTE